LARRLRKSNLQSSKLCITNLQETTAVRSRLARSPRSVSSQALGRMARVSPKDTPRNPFLKAYVREFEQFVQQREPCYRRGPRNRSELPRSVMRRRASVWPTRDSEGLLERPFLVEEPGSCNSGRLATNAELHLLGDAYGKSNKRFCAGIYERVWRRRARWRRRVGY